MSRKNHRRNSEMAPVDGDELPVDTAAPPPARPQRTNEAVLGTEGPRAPEPVGVPSPEVVQGAEPVASRGRAVVLEGAVVNCATGVVAGRPRLVRTPSEDEVGLRGGEDDPVDVIDDLTVEGALVHHLGQGRHERVDVLEPAVPKPHRAPDRLELDAESGGVAEGAVAVWEAAEQGGMPAAPVGGHEIG